MELLESDLVLVLAANPLALTCWALEGEVVPGSETLAAVPGVSTPVQVESSHKQPQFAQQNVTALGPKAVRVGKF